MATKEFAKTLAKLKAGHEALIRRRNVVDERFYNGVYTRYRNPALTGDHAPLEWRYDLDPRTNPFLMERLGVHAAFKKSPTARPGKPTK